ncbi:adenylate/guanylate cyclase domain-containing protein [Paenibacillus sp. UMB4589-SE434]|uniref:CHASE2 domain-containing protein n=1 Tax=Paenibacillus sp. UMB4589-SE434 TaxID=3046314 RepID=UPI00254E1A8F|nr:adenylate/guanylate cyclase domain-containing protein [Paenibacillus sp. UMB4589-SE434]MDK8182512.1 adenylate/guanylate cyclase domain-containing protein [Paenibacillus sp. UMB4589-SE434]
MRKKAFSIVVVTTITIVLSLSMTLMGHGGLFRMGENAVRDVLLLKTEQERSPNDRIKLITIDDYSIQQLGAYPWPRSIYAQLIEQLMNAGAKSVLLDLLMLEPSADLSDDEELAATINKWPQVYVPLQVNFPPLQDYANRMNITRIDRPAATLRVNPKQVGHANVMPDKDGVIRKLTIGLPDESGNWIPSIDVLLANELLPVDQRIEWEESSQSWKRGGADIPTEGWNQVTVDFYSSAYDDKSTVTEGYDRQSLADVLFGNIEPEYYKDCIVIIGPSSRSLGDMHMTPISRSLPLHGLEVHANMIQSLVEGHFYKEIPKVAAFLVILLAVVLAFASGHMLRGIRGMGMIMLMIGAYVVFGYVCFQWKSVYIPFLYGWIGMILGYMIAAVKRSEEERRGRKHVTHLFGRYVSPQVVKQLLESQVPIKPGGNRMDITVMFIDMRGFTPLSEQLPPEQTIAILNKYLHLCTDTIFRFEGTLDKFLGDGVMAIFGAPNCMEQHAERAVEAAAELLVQACELQEKLERESGIIVRFGVGLESGEAVVGNVGSEKLRMDYTAIGDTVNIAARLESKAGPGQLLIGPNAASRIADSYPLRTIGPMTLKGKSEPVMVFELQRDEYLKKRI